MLRKEDVEIIIAMGFTVLQAKAYLALVALEEADIMTISKAINVARQEIYRVIIELQYRGLVEKKLGKPVRFKAVPIQETIPQLLMNIHKERMEMHNKAMQLVERHTSRKRKLKRQEETRFLLIPEREAVSRRIKKAIEDSQQSIDIVSSRKKFLQALFDLSRSLSSALTRNVKVRWIIDKPLEPNVKPAILEILSESSLFKLRCVPHEPTQTFAIYDAKVIIVASNPKLDYTHSPALWTNATPLVDLAKNYFKKLWTQPLKDKAEHFRKIETPIL